MLIYMREAINTYAAQLTGDDANAVRPLPRFAATPPISQAEIRDAALEAQRIFRTAHRVGLQYLPRGDDDSDLED